MRFQRILFVLCMFVASLAHAANGVLVKTIVIDAGHGGKDPGAIGPGKTNEKDVALAVALKLGEAIKKSYPDVNIVYTRKTDVFIELHERAEIANKSKADLFIAIHCNSSPSATTYGTSTYVLGLHKTEANLEVAKRENAVILLEDDRDKNYEFDPNSPEGHIMMSMKQNAFLDQSIDMASKIESQFEQGAKRKSLGVKQAGFYVIYKTAMPSLLSEIGFISNPTEEKFLASAAGQQTLANSIFKAFKDYKFEIENSEGEQYAYAEAKRKAEMSSEGYVANSETTTLGAKGSSDTMSGKLASSKLEVAHVDTKTETKKEEPTASKPASTGTNAAKNNTAVSSTTKTSSSVDANSDKKNEAPSKQDTKAATGAAKTQATDEKTVAEKPAAKTSSSTTASSGKAETNSQPATSASANSNTSSVTTSNGKTVRKPVDNGSGGGVSGGAKPVEGSAGTTQQQSGTSSTAPKKADEKPVSASSGTGAGKTAANKQENKQSADLGDVPATSAKTANEPQPVADSKSKAATKSDNKPASGATAAKSEAKPAAKESSDLGDVPASVVKPESDAQPVTDKTESNNKATVKTDNKSTNAAKSDSKQVAKQSGDLGDVPASVVMPESDTQPKADKTEAKESKQADASAGAKTGSKPASSTTGNTEKATTATVSDKQQSKPQDSKLTSGAETTSKSGSTAKAEPKVASEPVKTKHEDEPVANKTERVKPESKSVAPVKEEKADVATTSNKNHAAAAVDPNYGVVEHKTEKGTMFKVQLYALRGKFREYSRAAQLFSEISSEEIGNGITRYYGGKAKSYAEAKKILETAVGNGYSDAFIVGFKDGSRLTPQELKGYEK